MRELEKKLINDIMINLQKNVELYLTFNDNYFQSLRYAVDELESDKSLVNLYNEHSDSLYALTSEIIKDFIKLPHLYDLRDNN